MFRLYRSGGCSVWRSVNRYGEVCLAGAANHDDVGMVVGEEAPLKVALSLLLVCGRVGKPVPIQVLVKLELTQPHPVADASCLALRHLSKYRPREVTRWRITTADPSKGPFRNR